MPQPSPYPHVQPPKLEVHQKRDTEEALDRSAPSGKVVYIAILAEGKQELLRSSSALAYSGLAAGLSMGFSMVAEGLLARYLPDAAWRPLVAKLGYSIGFLIVILGRQQLFTENTLTPILPLLQHPTWDCLRNVGRMWSIVLLTNLLGALALSLVAAHSSVFEAPVKAQFARMGHEALQLGFGTTLLRGLFAGWLIALMVWLLPFAEQARFWVIIFITYVVGVAHFSHVIAGSVEVFTTAALGRAGWGEVLGSFVLPALLGNIAGGVLLVAALNHAQITAGEEDK